MSNRRKKGGNDNTKKTTGNSRFSVLTDEKDTYNPFKGLKKKDVVTKVKPATNKNRQTQKVKAPPNPNLKKKELVETFADDITFEDIFSSWENGRSVDNVKKKSKNMKKSEVHGDEDFASVFAQWENSQGIAPIPKKTPPRKSENYKPTRDFGQLLDQFEGHVDKQRVKKTQDINQILKRTDEDDSPSVKENKKNQIQTKSKVKNLSELPKNYKIICQSASIKQNENNKHINKNRNNKFENNNRNTEKEINNEQTTTISNKNRVQEFTKIHNNKKSEIENIGIHNTKIVKDVISSQVEEKEVAIKTILAAKEFAAKELVAKELVAKELVAKELVAKELVAKELVAKELVANKRVISSTLTNKNKARKDGSKDKKCSWNVDSNISEKYLKDDDEVVKEVVANVIPDKHNKLDNKRNEYRKNVNNSKSNNANNSKSNNEYKKKEISKKRAPFVVAPISEAEEVPSKWNFSDIYRAWSSENEEDKAISEAKKLKDKKGNKGISISYLRSMSPQDEIDLHGFSSDLAMLKTREFLEQSRDKGLKKVSIITGKGIHSKDGKGILHDVALSEIRLSGIVREAYNPKAVDGGSGAIWVIFKSTTDKKVYF